MKENPRGPGVGAPAISTEDEKETGRIEAFSDGVFAIAITLLILDIKVPAWSSLGHGLTLGTALLRQWPAYLAYVSSYLTVLIMWMNHHKLFRHIRRADHVFLAINGLLLMAVTAVPFPTALLSAYISTSEARTAGAVYSGMFLVIALLFFWLWRYASHHRRLLVKSLDVQGVEAINRQFRFGPPLYVLAFGFALWNVWAGLGMCTALAIFFAFPGVEKPRVKQSGARDEGAPVL